MDYKNERKEEVARAIQLWEDGEITRENLEYIFPGLKESKDERIRKAIIEFFELQDDNTTYSLVSKKDILIWLEKQGDKEKPQVYETEDGEIITYSEIDGYKVVEPKDALKCVVWTEEDERNWCGITDEIETNKSSAPDYDIETYDKFLSWLHSIKQRMGG